MFERQGKKLLGLTPLGERIMQEVVQINQAKHNIRALAEDFLDNRHGALHIATTHTQAKYLLPNAIQKFRDRYPQLKIYIIQSSPDNLVNLLHHHQADIAICTEKLDGDDKLILQPCYEWHHIAIVPKNHPLVGETITLARLIEFPILTYMNGFTGRSNIEKAFKNEGLELDITLAAADSDIIKTYVRLGLGVGIIAETAYEPNSDSDLVALDLSHLISHSVTKIAYLKQLYLPSYCRFFISELLKTAQQKNSFCLFNPAK